TASGTTPSAPSRSSATASGTTSQIRRSCTSARSRKQRPRPRRWKPRKARPMAKTFHCTVITPERPVLEREATFVAFPAFDGEMGVLPHRAPLLAKLGAGELRVESPAGDAAFFINGGFAQMVDDKLTLLTEEAMPKA